MYLASKMGAKMAPGLSGPAGPMVHDASGRRTALRAVAGVGAAVLALAGRAPANSAPVAGVGAGPAGPLSSVDAAKKKKRGKRGPTGPTGPAATLSQNEATNNVPDGSNANAQANCLSGQATGGGASLSNIACELVSSNVVGTSAWGATGRCPAGQVATLTVRVICLG